MFFVTFFEADNTKTTQLQIQTLKFTEKLDFY